MNPRWADAWVNCGLSRYRQGAIEGAKVAMREALRYAPDHGAAKDNLAALLRMDDGQPAMSAAPEARAPPAVDRGERCASRRLDSGQRPGAEDDAVLSTWRPKDPAAALGLAVEFLSRKPAFAKLQFGEWSQVLFYQVARGHFFFVVDQDRS